MSDRMIITTMIISFIIVYGLGLFFWNKRTVWRLNEKPSKRVRYFHYALTALVIVSVILELFDGLSFSGQWTTRIIIIGFLVTGIIIYPLTNWVNEAKIERYYFLIFSWLPILTGFIAFIPFLGLIIIVSVLGQLTDPVTKIFYEDNKMIVQSSFAGALGPPDLLIYEKRGLLKKRLNDSYRIERYASDVNHVKVSNDKENTLIIMMDESRIMDTLRIKRID